MDAKFEQTPFRLGYLTQQNAVWGALGVNLGGKFSPSQLVKGTDKIFVVAYPYFNPRGGFSAAIFPCEESVAPLDELNWQLSLLTNANWHMHGINMRWISCRIADWTHRNHQFGVLCLIWIFESIIIGSKDCVRIDLLSCKCVMQRKWKPLKSCGTRQATINSAKWSSSTAN